MSTASVEALAFGVLAAFWLAVSLLAFRLQRRTGTRSQWRWVGLVGVALCLTIMTITLSGHALTGPAGTTHG